MEFGLSEREKILREFGIGPLEELYVGALDERIKADELINSGGIRIRDAKHIYDEREKKEYIKINLEIASLSEKKSHESDESREELPHKVTLYLEPIREKRSTKEYFVKMEKTEHECEETKYITSGADHHMLAAKGYVEKNLADIGKDRHLGKMRSYIKYIPIPEDIVNSFYSETGIDANIRLRRAYEYARERYLRKQRHKERAKKTAG